MPSTETGLSVGLPPNQGVASLPQPSSSALPAMEFILWSSGIRRACTIVRGRCQLRSPADEESILGRQDRPVLQIGRKEGEVARLGPQGHDGPRHVVPLAGERLDLPPFRRAHVQQS